MNASPPRSRRKAESAAYASAAPARTAESSAPLPRVAPSRLAARRRQSQGMMYESGAGNAAPYAWRVCAVNLSLSIHV